MGGQKETRWLGEMRTNNKRKHKKTCSWRNGPFKCEKNGSQDTSIKFGYMILLNKIYSEIMPWRWMLGLNGEKATLFFEVI